MFEKLIDRGTLLAVTVLIVCVLGIVASLRIPVQMIPGLIGALQDNYRGYQESFSGAPGPPPEKKGSLH